MFGRWYRWIRATRHRTAMAVAIIGVIVVAVIGSIVVAVHSSGPHETKLMQANKAWHLAVRQHPTPGYLYQFSRDCRVVMFSAQLADRPMEPVGDPIRSWRVVPDTYRPGHCPKNDPNLLGAFAKETRHHPNVPLLIGTGPWVFSSLGPAAALAAHIIPSLPLTDERHPYGYPGYAYELSRDCSVTVYAFPVQHRPFLPDYVADPNGQVEQFAKLSTANGTYSGGHCSAPASIQDGVLFQISIGQLRYFGQWVYSQLTPEAAFKAGLIPTLPRHEYHG